MVRSAVSVTADARVGGFVSGIAPVICVLWATNNALGVLTVRLNHDERHLVFHQIRKDGLGVGARAARIRPVRTLERDHDHVVNAEKTCPPG